MTTKLKLTIPFAELHRRGAEGRSRRRTERREREHRAGQLTRERVACCCSMKATFEELDKLSRIAAMIWQQDQRPTATALSPDSDALMAGLCMCSHRISPCLGDRFRNRMR